MNAASQIENAGQERPYTAPETWERAHEHPDARRPFPEVLSEHMERAGIEDLEELWEPGVSLELCDMGGNLSQVSDYVLCGILVVSFSVHALRVRASLRNSPSRRSLHSLCV